MLNGGEAPNVPKTSCFVLWSWGWKTVYWRSFSAALEYAELGKKRESCSMRMGMGRKEEKHYTSYAERANGDKRPERTMKEKSILRGRKGENRGVRGGEKQNKWGERKRKFLPYRAGRGWGKFGMQEKKNYSQARKHGFQEESNGCDAKAQARILRLMRSERLK